MVNIYHSLEEQLLPFSGFQWFKTDDSTWALILEAASSSKMLVTIYKLTLFIYMKT
jgi:hypothetical protein